MNEEQICYFCGSSQNLHKATIETKRGIRFTGDVCPDCPGNKNYGAWIVPEQAVELCGDESNNNDGYGCELPKGHNGRHQAAYSDGDETGIVYWDNDASVTPYPGEIRDLVNSLTGYLTEIKLLEETIESALYSNDLQHMRDANKRAAAFTSKKMLGDEIPF